MAKTLCFGHSECNRVNWYVKLITLRTAKTSLSFGHLECNRVKPQLNNNKYAKFDDYRYHTFRNGPGTTDDRQTDLWSVRKKYKNFADCYLAPDPPCKTDLDFSDCFGGKKALFHSKTDLDYGTLKTLSHTVFFQQ